MNTTQIYKNLSLESLPNEIWKDIPDYEGLYQVSNLGRVKSLHRLDARGRVIAERILKPTYNNQKEYLYTSIYRKGIRKTYQIHQLVAITFLNHKPSFMKKIINHINFKRQDNRLSNLEIVTPRENGNKKHLKSTSKYVGVSWCNTKNKWRSRIHYNKKMVFIGYFDNEIDAHQAYQNKLKQIIS